MLPFLPHFGEFQTTPAKLSALSLALGLALPAAVAQGSAEPVAADQTLGKATEKSGDAADTSKLGVVIVTAQRRAEELQKTPVAITALSQAEMELKQIRRLDDLKFEVPNVIIEASTATTSAAKIFMRGVGVDDSLFTNDPSVAIYVDDMYVARSTGAMFDMFDLERVEVLRGPQGTLYGRNATGGAVRYVTKKPDGASRLGIEGRVGNYGRVDLQLSGGDLIDNKIAVSYGLMSKSRGGYLRDITNNRDVNDEKVTGARLGLAMDVTKDTNVRLFMDTVRQRSGPPYASGILNADKAALYKRPVNNADGDLLTAETDLVNGDNALDQTGATLSFSTDMGAFEWRSILTHRTMSNQLYADLDASAQRRYHLYQDQSQRQSSIESQLVSLGSGPFSWTGGVFAFAEKNDQPTRQDIFTIGGVTNVGQKTQALAVYGQGDYQLSNIWKATGGLRYSHESKDFSLFAHKADGSANFSFRDKHSWSRADWKLGLAAQWSPELLTYASATTGFRSGGFNGRAATAAAAALVLKPETVLTYEFGFKSTLAGGALRLNANYFRNDYRDLQLQAYDADGNINLTNATSALIQGIEADAALQINREWQLGMNLGTLDAKYKNYSDLNAGNFAGKPLKLAPKLQYGLSASYRASLGSGQLLLNAQLKHVSEQYQNVAASEVIKTAAYTLVDARIAYEAGGGKWSLGLWGRNLGNKLYYAGAFDIPALGIADAYINVPRTFGLDARYRFW